MGSHIIQVSTGTRYFLCNSLHEQRDAFFVPVLRSNRRVLSVVSVSIRSSCAGIRRILEIFSKIFRSSSRRNILIGKMFDIGPCSATWAENRPTTNDLMQQTCSKSSQTLKAYKITKILGFEDRVVDPPAPCPPDALVSPVTEIFAIQPKALSRFPNAKYRIPGTNTFFIRGLCNAAFILLRILLWSWFLF